MKYSKTEKEVKNITVHDKSCIGCKRTGTHMMLSYNAHDSDEIIDLFLNKQQTEYLITQIYKKIQNNNSMKDKQIWFTITTNKEVADKIKKQCEWNEKMNIENSFILGDIQHKKGLVSDYSVVQIKSRDGRKIELSEIFFLGLFAGVQ